MGEHVQVCQLCEEPAALRESHVIPRSYYRRLKKEGGGSGQLVSIKYDGNSPPAKSNSNPTEKLLCSTCEKFLDREYEKYGTRALISAKNTTVFEDYINVKNFKYKKAFLYFASILWRASISMLPEFQRANLTPKLNEHLRRCIKGRTFRIDKNLSLNDYLRISVLRVVDKEGVIEDSIIKNMLMTFGVEPGSESEVTLLYYFMVDGFVVCYLFYAHGVGSRPVTPMSGVLVNRNRIKIPKVDVTELKQIHEAFSYVSKLSNRSV